MYKLEILENRKNLELSNDLVVVTTNEQANALKPLTIYKWDDNPRIRLRQFNKNQFGDLLFTDISQAISEKEFSYKELESNKKYFFEEITKKRENLKRVISYKNRIKSDSMESGYITSNWIQEIIKRYDIKLTLNQYKNIGLVDTIYYKNSLIDAIAVNKGSRLQVTTVIKIIDLIKSQLNKKA